MKVTTISAALPLPNAGLLFDLDALYRCLQTVPDQRSRQGLRYPEFLPAVGEFLAKGRQMIAQVIQERTGIDETRAQAMAAVIHACTDGLALQQLAQPDRDFTTAYQLVQRLFAGEPVSGH